MTKVYVQAKWKVGSKPITHWYSVKTEDRLKVFLRPEFRANNRVLWRVK